MKASTTLFLTLSLSLGLAASLVLTGCDTFDERDRTFDGDPKLEFAPLAATVDEGDDPVTTRIQLIGEQRGSDLPVDFVVADSSTAEAGVHYSLGSTSASIPANASAVDVTIDILDNTVDDGDTNYELFLVLQDSDGVEAAVNLRTYTLTIRGVDE